MKFYRIKAILMQDFFSLRHSLDEMIDTFWWPLIDIVIWGLTIRYLKLGGAVGFLVNFLLAAVILWIIVYRTQQEISENLLRNVWSDSMVNLFASPLTIWEFLVGTILASLIKIILALTTVIAVAYFLYSFNLFSLGLGILPFFINLLLFAWAAGIFITGLIIRFGSGIGPLAWSFIAVIQPFSCVFYPLASLPAWMQKVAWFLPTTHVFEGMRGVLADRGFSLEHLIWSIGLNVLYLLASSLFFNLMFEKARKAGRLVKTE